MTRVLVNSNGKAFTTSNNRVLSSSGITPSGSISITENDTYDVTNYASAVVNVSGGGSTKFGLTVDNFIGAVTNGVLSAPSQINGITFTGLVELSYNALQYCFYSSLVYGSISFPDLTVVRNNGLYQTFQNNTITSVNLSALTTVENYGLYNSFPYNQITSVDLSALTTIGSAGLNGAFNDNQITSVSLPALTTVEDEGLNNTFYNNQITSVDLSALTTIGGYGLMSAFSSNRITSVSLPALTTVGADGLLSAFANNIDPDTQQTTLQTVSFSALTSNSFESGDESAFGAMLSGNDGVTVHFPSNLQNVIGNWQSVLDGFSGTNTTILFDLPATE